jgi:hypothetical protein
MLEKLLEKSPDGLTLNFSLKSNPQNAYAGSVRKCRMEGAPEGLYEAHCVFPGKNQHGNVVEVHTRMFFDVDDLAMFMVPVDPPKVVSGSGLVIPGLRGN